MGADLTPLEIFVLFSELTFIKENTITQTIKTIAFLNVFIALKVIILRHPVPSVQFYAQKQHTFCHMLLFIRNS
jgi:hypothetical protein